VSFATTSAANSLNCFNRTDCSFTAHCAYLPRPLHSATCSGN
jgi:hypothetical protein